MLELLGKLAAFLFAISLLIGIHEFGHFWAARRLGVKVLRFSLGFGTPLLTWRRRDDPTEYVLAAWPLGGYIKMVDEREEPVAPEDLPWAFNRQPLWKRSAIVAAGPVANFLFAFFVYWFTLTLGEAGTRPEVGAVAPDSIAAAAGFASGDQVLAVDGRPTPTWDAVWRALLDGVFERRELQVAVRAADGAAAVRVLPAAHLGTLDPSRDLLPALGLSLARPTLEPVLGEVVPREPAMEAGLRRGDRIAAIDDREITRWDTLVEVVRAHPETPLRLRVERGADTLTVVLVPRALTIAGERVGRIGAAPLVPAAVTEARQVIVRHGPLEAAGMAAARVVDVSVLTLRLIGRMLTGHAALDNLSSPIGIADTAGKTAAVGFEPFVKFLALLSISLGLLNLLPIPILDGGHLLFFALEAILRRPLPEAVFAYGQRIGLGLLLGLMSLAFYADLARLLG